MTMTLAQMKVEAYNKYQTNYNKFSDFPVSTRVKVITPMCDRYCFFEETGIVISNSGRYLGIEIRFDKPRKFMSGLMQTTFNFGPKDLWVMPVAPVEEKVKPESLRHKRFYKWIDESSLRMNAGIKQAGWIAAMNEVRQFLRDMTHDSHKCCNTCICTMNKLDEILQKEIEG